MENDMPAPRGAEVWRDFVTDMVPSSGLHQPSKADARAWSAWLESLVTSGVLSSGPWFATQASMTLGYAANTVAVVYADPDAAKNGLYRKSGASGAGAWTQLTSFLPGYQFVMASPIGASTPNEIVAVTSPRLPAGDGVALVTLAIPQTNTATPVTVRFDGGAILTVKTRSGENPAIGEFQKDDLVSGFVSGSTFRLIVDPNSLLHMQAAKEWANNAEDSPVSSAAGGDGITTFSARHWAAKSDEAAERSEAAQDRSEAASEAARSAAEASGDVVFFDSHSAATAALASLPDLQVVSIFSDETRDGRRAFYRKEGAILVFKAFGGEDIATLAELKEGTSATKLTTPYLVTNAFKYRGFVSPLDFGVPAAGNDITAPFLAACAAEDIFAVTLPPGVWHIEDEPTVTDKPFTLKGFGKEVSQLHQHTAGKNALRFISSHTYARWNDFYYRTIALHLEGLSLVSATDNPAAGVYASWVDFVDETCFFSARDVKIMADEFTHSFETGLHLKNCNGTLLDGVHMVGDVSRRSNPIAAPYNFNKAIWWECGTNYPKVSHVIRGFRCRDINTAFKMTGWAEGFYFNNCDPVLVGRCFDWDGYSVIEGGVNNPNLHITNSHLNFREHGVVVKDTYNVFIDNVDFLKDGEPGGSIDGSCILLNNAPIVTITGNRLGRASVHTGIVRGIQATDNINGYRIQGNFIDGMNTESINLSGDGADISITDNILVGAGSPQVGIRTGASIGGGVVTQNVFRGTWALRTDIHNDTVKAFGNVPEDGFVDFPNGAVTPSVGGYNSTIFSAANTVATSITNFYNPTPGQEILLVAQNANTTLIHSVSLILAGAVDWNMPAGSCATFKFDGSSWRETGRTIV